ncbi:MAG TPA: MFS transporter [Candidatus Binatia bacterium]|nr:MFS transporter [Candidatus Binatia bacterium]
MTSVPPGRRALTVGLVLTVSVTAFEALAVATILPETVREIGGLAQYGWVFSGFMLANLAAIPLAGRAADRRGPGPPFVVGAVLFTAGLIVAGLAPSMAVLVTGRVVQGAGAAALSSVAYVAVARAYPASEQPGMLALLASAWVVPGLFGPAVAAGVARAAGWRAVFLGLVPLTVVACGLALGGLRTLRASAASDAPPSTGRVRDAMLVAAGVTMTLLAVRSTQPVLTVGLAIVGIVVASFALLRLLPAGTLRARAGLPAAIAVLALVNFAFFAVEAFLPLAIADVRHAGNAVIATALTVGTLSWSAGSWVQARLAGRWTRRALLRTGLTLLVIGLASASAPLVPGLPTWITVVAWTFAGLGIGIVYPVTTLAILESAPDGREGEVSATMQIANALAIALGTGLGGDLLARLAADGGTVAMGIASVNAAAVAAGLVALVAMRGVAEAKGTR